MEVGAMSKNLTSLLAFDSYWEMKSQFLFKGVTPGRLITFQDMAQSQIVRQHQLDTEMEKQRNRDRKR